MPARFVPRRVGDFILYYYAKLVIARSAGFEGNYRFIVDTYRRLKRGEIFMSDYHRELLHMAQDPNRCNLCGGRTTELKPVHIVPRHLGGPTGIHNLVTACSTCAESKDEKDLVKWWCKELGRPRDELPRVPIGLYLKIAHEIHTTHFTLKRPCQSLEHLFENVAS